jgi:hypothetical protein
MVRREADPQKIQKALSGDVTVFVGSRMTRVCVVAGLSLLLSGCATHRYLSSDGHRAFESRDYERAAALFAKDASKPGSNQILFMLDQSSAHFSGRDYKKAIPVLLSAADLVAVKDFTSISEEVGTLATSDNVRAYKGEDFEKVLIHVYLALAFAALDQTESAQVEARRINELLYRMISEGRRNYQESPWARYLSALLWEQSGDWNSAYVDYKKTFELEPTFPGLGQDLLALAARMRFSDDEIKWRKAFPTEQARKIPKGFGEIVLILETGRSPIKVPRDENSSLPRFIKRSSFGPELSARWGELRLGAPELVLNVEDLSIRYLEDRISRMAAAKLAGTVAKGALAYGLGRATQNEDLGWMAFAVLAATDQADLRSWKSLPARFEMIRMAVPEGTSTLRLEAGGVVTEIPELRVRAGKKTFVPLRL